MTLCNLQRLCIIRCNVSLLIRDELEDFRLSSLILFLEGVEENDEDFRSGATLHSTLKTVTAELPVRPSVRYGLNAEWSRLAAGN